MIGRSKKADQKERMKGFIDDPRNQLYRYFLKFAEKTNQLKKTKKYQNKQLLKIMRRW